MIWDFLSGKGEAIMDGEISEIQHRERARTDIQAGAELSIAYLLMNVLAATIASYGLFVNSPAVIIGAMLIAMLLGPITGISLALVDSDMKSLLRGFLTLLAGAAVVFVHASSAMTPAASPLPIAGVPAEAVSPF